MMLLVIFLILMAFLTYLVQEAKTSRIISLMAIFGAWILWTTAYQLSTLSNWQAVPFINDGLSQLLSLLILFLGTLAFVYTSASMRSQERTSQHIALLLLLMAFSIAVCQAGDIFNLWLWFEALAFASTMLVTFHREDELALEASFKYLIQSAIGSSLILVGIALVFTETGSLSFSEIDSLENTALIASFFVIGFGVKAAFVPLHTWLPDAHSQAPSAVSALLSAVVIEVALLAMLRCLSILEANSGLLLMGFATLNILLGNLLALEQDEIKRLLAYSSVAHLGYICLAFGIGLYTGEIRAFEAAFFHLLSHGLMKALAFFAVGSLLFLGEGKHFVLRLESLNGLGKRFPMIGFALSLALLGLAGLPPMLGFFSKWQIFLGAVTSDNAIAFLFIGIAALGSILSLGYYAPLVARIYQKNCSELLKTEVTIPLGIRLPIFILACLVLFLGFYPSLLSPFFRTAALALLGR
jgi:proton-translocating NADH-quinone oxidoreductase chain N